MQWGIGALFGVYGLAIGSFLAVCIERLSCGESVRGRSHCPACGKKLGWSDLVPLVSFLILGGQCQYCGAKISWRYPFIEGGTALLFAACGYCFGFSGQAVVWCAVFSVLIIISGLDGLTGEIHDEWNGVLAGLGVLMVWLEGDYTWQQALLGAGIVSVPLAVIAWVTGGIGGGDVKMMAALGVVLGPRLVVLDFFIGCVSAALVSVGLMILGKVHRRSTIAWGPFLALGAVVAILAGDTVVDWYLNLLRA